VPTQSWTSGVASAAGSVAVELKQIPNQPIVFKVFSFAQIESIAFIFDFLFNKRLIHLNNLVKKTLSLRGHGRHS